MGIEKKKIAGGLIWSTIERLSVQGIQFLFQIFLARLLSPSDYGVIAMLSVFMAVSQSLIDAGFTNALIRKTDRTDVDVSTVFYFNLLISILLYFLLFLFAPMIANFYHIEALAKISRVYMLALPISALGARQRTIYTINLDFKKLAKASLAGAVGSGIVGIFFAWKGFGAWALVYSALANNAINVILMWAGSPWRPKLAFSIISLKQMFMFGSKLMLSSLLNTIYTNLQQLVIGRRFSAQNLGYYSRADQFAKFPSSNITSIFQRVTYPVLCKMADNEEKLISAYRRFLKLSSFIIFPLMIGLSAVAKPFILLLLGEKWSYTAVILKIICLSYMWYPVHAINLNVLMVKGRSDLFFRVEIIKKVLGISILAFTMQFNIAVMAFGSLVASIVSLFINTYYTKRLLSYGIFDQAKDLAMIFLLSLISCLPAFIISENMKNHKLAIVISIISSFAIYFFSCKAMKIKELSEIIEIARSNFSKKGRIHK